MFFFVVVASHKFTSDIRFSRFYKEFLAGETNNYVYNRTHVTGRSIPDTLQDIVDDTLAANARIMEILKSMDALTTWKHFVNGMLYVCSYFISLKILTVLFL